MDDNETAIVLMALVVSPFLLFLRSRRAGSKNGQPAPDMAQMQALAATAERMERRIESLEMLLDNELPGWRSRSRTP